MSTKPLMLDGLMPVDDPKVRDGAIHEWRKEKQHLEEEVRGLRHDLDEAEAKNEALERSVRNLRRQLSPLHNALRAVFGEIELAVGEEQAVTSSSPIVHSASGSSDPRWESYKSNFPGLPAQIIDALLSHPDMSIPQLAAFVRKAYGTVKDVLQRLKKAGAVVSEGGKYRLNR